ncbi:rho GTPase-activating protein 18 isoform X2 [Ciona intestinalis]
MSDKYKLEGGSLKQKDLPIVLRINRLEPGGEQSSRAKQVPTEIPLNKSASKSEDSLDSGIYSRQKSCDSMDSLDSTESSGFNGDNSTGYHQVALTPTDEAIPPLPIQQYEDYWREYQDIRQSAVVLSEETKQTVSRTDSGDDQDDDGEADWLRLAGLSDLVVTGSTGMMASNQTPSSSNRPSMDNLSSMTVLSTLTRPQREAVLRRITSFNRAQKTKRRPKPAITAVFPTIDTETKDEPDGPHSTADKPGDTRKNDDPNLKAASLPRGVTGFSDSGFYAGRRYSETPKTRKTSGSNSPVSPTSPTKDYRSRHQKNVESIVATESTKGIETLSISTRSADSKSWGGSREEIPQFHDEKQDKNMSYSETADKQNLPNFSLVREPLGITKISDLSPTDMRKVQSLALIELTALFDLRGIELKRRKAKAKIKDAGVFGSPLTTLLEWDRKRTNLPTIKIPQVLREIIIFLETKALKDEGILRKSGSAARIKLLKQDIENRFGPNPDTTAIAESSLWRDAHPHDIAALLKLFLRELPDPLLTTEYIDAFHSCEMISERKEQLQALNLLIILLHEMHRDSLQFLLSFLGLVVANEPYNKMGLNNVAMITAPNLFMARKQSKREASTTAASQDLKRAAGTSNIVRMLIKYHRLLWTVPAFMLTQVRHMHRAETSAKKHTTQSKDKYKVKFFQGKTKDGNKKSSSAKQPLEYEPLKGVIRVQAPDMLISSMAVQLDNTITASDIIARFQRQSERIRQTGSQTKPVVINNTTHALYEVGGNIHQRCLDPDTNMSALMRVNPDASWFIKPRTGT